MTDKVLATLAGLAENYLPDFEKGGRVLFAHARETSQDQLISRWLETAGEIICYQPFYELHSFPSGLKAVSLPQDIPPGPYNMIWICAGRHKTEIKGLVQKALRHIRDDGVILISAANTAGGRSLEKLVHNQGGRIKDSLIKNKCRALAFEKAEPEGINQETSPGEITLTPQWNEQTNLWSCAGIYGDQKIDKGSELLIPHIQNQLSREIGDFGCGTGYLLLKLLQGQEQKKGQYLKLRAIDHDARALECARRNLEGLAGDIHFIWGDCTSELPGLTPLNHIVMNPPFHNHSQSDLALGQGFIQNAARYLKPGGVLHMVANRHLAYEKILSRYFLEFNIAETRSGFKILKATKG